MRAWSVGPAKDCHSKSPDKHVIVKHTEYSSVPVDYDVLRVHYVDYQ